MQQIIKLSQLVDNVMTKMFVYITRERSIERQLLLNIIMQNFSILSLPPSLSEQVYILSTVQMTG